MRSETPRSRRRHRGGVLVRMRRLFRETRVALVPDEDALPRWFVEELEVLGLAGAEFGPEEYARRLADHLGIKIVEVPLADEEYPEFREQMAGRGHFGSLVREDETGDALILVPRSLGEIRRHLLIYHECAHIACGHRMPRPGVGTAGAADPEDPSEWYDPVLAGHGRLAAAPPPLDPDECEAQARSRARLAFRAGLYGEQLVDEDEEFFGKPR